MNNLVSCYLNKCKKENKIVDSKFNSYNNTKSNLVKLYYNKHITKDKFILLMSKISKLHFKSPYYRDFVNCIFQNCYKSVCKYLDSIITTINYKKPIKYGVNNFIEIMIIKNKYTVINFLVKKYAPKK
jgi:hypothetical protein